MAQIKVGTTDIPTAGTRVQIRNTNERVKQLRMQGALGNAGNVFFGISDVSGTNGWGLDAGQQLPLDFKDGSVRASDLWADTDTGGNDIDWILIIEG